MNSPIYGQCVANASTIFLIRERPSGPPADVSTVQALFIMSEVSECCGNDVDSQSSLSTEGDFVELEGAA